MKSNLPSCINLYRIQVTFNGFDETGEEIPEFVSAKTELEAKEIIEKYCDDAYYDWADEVETDDKNLIKWTILYISRHNNDGDPWAEYIEIKVNKIY